EGVGEGSYSVVVQSPLAGVEAGEGTERNRPREEIPFFTSVAEIEHVGIVEVVIHARHFSVGILGIATAGGAGNGEDHFMESRKRRWQCGEGATHTLIRDHFPRGESTKNGGIGPHLAEGG